jgi:protein-S-isoprenylcysteine O-methyltransferase Ste14
MPSSDTSRSGDGQATRKAIIRRVSQLMITLVLFAASLFLTSGRLDWVMAWVYLGLYVGMIVATGLVIERDLVAERSRVGEGTKDWDRVLGSLSIFLVTPGALLVAGLDERFGWSRVALVVQLIALGFVILGSALTVWAVASNRYFSATVRIQKDRGHTIVSSGPYGSVRHPGYLAWCISAPAIPLMLGSLWALMPALLGVCALLIRTVLEDRTLREELPGYQDHARRVRYRLVPGLW